MRMSRRMGLYGSKKLFTWAKYNAVTTYEKVTTQANIPYDMEMYYVGSDPTFSSTTGFFTYKSPMPFTSQFSYANKSMLDGSYLYKTNDDKNTYVIRIIECYETYAAVHKYTSVLKSATQGTTSYGTVSSADPNAYPTNGVHTDGYWYVLQ